MGDFERIDFQRVNHGRYHSYKLDGAKVPGVTTIVGMLPKDNLIRWAAGSAAAYAVDHWADLSHIPVSERIKDIAGAPSRDRDEAGQRGKEIHRIAERLNRGEKVTVPDDIAGYVEACVRFLDDFEVQPQLLERPVLNVKWGYRGTLDAVVSMRGVQGLALLDFKSSRSGIWPETALQLAGYRYADCYAAEDGTNQPMPPISSCWAVWLRADGYNCYPVTAGLEEHRLFLYLKQVLAFTGRDRGEFIGEPLRVEDLEAAPA